MNTPNNKRRKESQKRIARAFIEMMQTSEVSDISVTKLCKLANVNRTTFYACYEDVYDLSRQILNSLIEQVNDIYQEEHLRHYNSDDWSKLIHHIYDNQLFYVTCFKLGIDRLPVQRYDNHYAEEYFDNKYIEYHIEFFKAGFNRIIKMWLDGGCKETPEEIEHIIKTEYAGRKHTKDNVENSEQ